MGLRVCLRTCPSRTQSRRACPTLVRRGRLRISWDTVLGIFTSSARSRKATAFPLGADFSASGRATPSQNVEPQHPPHKKKRDDAEDNVCHPLARGFWFSKVKHCGNPSIPFSRGFFSEALPAAPLLACRLSCPNFTRLILTIDILSG